MASLPLLKTGKQKKCLSCNKISYYHFFIGLFVFTVLSFLFFVIFNVFSGSSTRADYFEPVNLDYKTAQYEVVRGSPATPRIAKCTYWDCFNVYKCGRGGHDKITVYIYPLKNYKDENGKAIAQYSQEFAKILNTIKKSKFYTPNPDQACLFIPSIDTLSQPAFDAENVARALHTLEYWNDGENHLIFNMLPGSPPNYNTVVDLNTGKSIIAGAGYDTWTFRHGFDISLPIFSEIATKITKSQPKIKKHLILSTQTNIPSEYMLTLRNIASSSTDLLLLHSCSTSDSLKRCDYTTKEEYSYPEVLKDGVFCLVIRGARLAQAVLLDVLASQCIPIIVADSIVMPFNSHIDWERIALFIPEGNLKNLLNVVYAVSNERLTEMNWQLRWVYDKYFSSIEKITLTTLEVLNERVFPLSAKMYEEWNLAEELYGPPNPLFLPVTAPKSAGFTAVILTYDRVESLFTLIKTLVKTPSLVKVIVVWNNQKKAPPPASEWPVISKPLKVIQTKENKLSNRFYPYDDIETECQLTIDDDITMLTPGELEFGFDVWREFPDRIVGFPSRLHLWDNVTNSWKYHSEWTNEISMVLTGAAFHHKLWSHYYTRHLPAEIRNWVDDNFNCEDIAMNFLVAHATGKPAIKVTPRKKFKCPECTNTEMLSADATHMSQRSYCINYFAKIFGHMALKPVEFRADPLQYLETGTGVPQLYPDIGAL